MLEHGHIIIDHVDCIYEHKHLDIHDQHEEHDLEHVLEKLFDHVMVIVRVDGV